jgi:hypothetical protein
MCGCDLAVFRYDTPSWRTDVAYFPDFVVVEDAGAAPSRRLIGDAAQKGQQGKNGAAQKATRPRLQEGRTCETTK